MTAEKKRNPLEEIRKAISLLESKKSLTSEKLLADYYVERTPQYTATIKNLLQYTPGQPIKLLFSGHTGCGKSSELFKLKTDLKNEFIAIYYSIMDHMNLSGIKAAHLLESMGRQLVDAAGQHNVNIDKKILEALERWPFTQRETRYSDEKRSGMAGLGGELPLVKAGGAISKEKGKKTEETWEREPDINELVALLNQIVETTMNETEKEIIIFIDDIDKIDLADSEALFLRYSRTLTSLKCKIIYTVPISLYYSHHIQQFKSFYYDSYLLPIPKVRNKDGSPNSGGIDSIKEIISRRIPVALFAGGVLDDIITASGGIIRDAIRIVQKCCLRCSTEEKSEIDKEIAEVATADLKNDFRRQLTSDLYPKLIEVKNSPEKDPDVDTELQRLLYALGVLEYTNKDTWYDIHPLVLELVEAKEKELKSKQKDT